jgi:uncharacterized protein (DUF1778 family)
MARPKLSPQERHSEQINIPLKPADLAYLQDSAEKAATTITDFVRASALGHEFTVVQTTAPDLETVEQLRRIGVNLNQIAKAMNQGRTVPPPSLDRVCLALEDLLTKWLIDDPTNNHRPQF